VWLCLEVSFLTTAAWNDIRAIEVVDYYLVNRIIRKYDEILSRRRLSKGGHEIVGRNRNYNFTEYNFARIVLT
jgi:hypothetical protein